MRPPSLAELQAELKRYLLVGDNEELLAGQVKSSGEMPATSRLDVYRNAYYTRLQDALAHDFPALLAVAGDKGFGALCTAYLTDHPSTRPSLRWLGQHFSGWLRRREHALVHADLAALEWAILHAFDAADAPTMSAASLASLPAERWPELRVTLHPSISLLEVRTNARELWLATRKSAALPETRESREWLVVWRSRRAPSVESVSREFFSLLSALGRGEVFASACEGLIDLTAPGEIPYFAAACLHIGLERGWVVGVMATAEHNVSRS